MEKVGEKLPRRIVIKGNVSPVSFLWSGSLLFTEILKLGVVKDRKLWIYALLSVSSEMDGNWDSFQQWALPDHAVGSPHLQIPSSGRKAMCSHPREGEV